MFENLKEGASVALYFSAWRVVRWLPENTAYRFFDFVADFAVKRNGKGIQRLRSNLVRVKPDANSSEIAVLLGISMRSAMRYWCDTFRFPDWSRSRTIDTVEVVNENFLLDAIAAKRGVIVSLPHAGNWDHAGAYFCDKGIKLVTVAERVKPDALFQKFLSYREAMGMEVLPVDGRVIAVLAQRLREGHLIALVADRDLSKSGITVDFFAGKARMPAGPAVLAIKTGAPLITAFVSYRRKGIHIEFTQVEIPTTGTQEEKVQKIVQNCADEFARGISAYPQDWHMLQRIWIDGDFTERSDG